MGSYLRLCRLPGLRSLLAATEVAGCTGGALNTEARPRSSLPSLLHWYSTQLPLAQGAKTDLSFPVLNFQRQQVGTKVLAGDVFNVPVRKDILHRVVRWQLAKRQQGTHLTKTRSDVRGGGRKPWAQKGSGRARQGSIRSPQWRGGGVIFGPVLRSHEHKLFKKVRRLGLLCALSAKASEGRLWVLNSLAIPEGKTGTLDKSLDVLLEAPEHRSVLMIDSGKTSADGGESVRRAAENLPWVDVLPQEGANVYSILQRAHLVLTAPAVDALTERLQRPITRGPRDIARRLSVANAPLVQQKNLSLLRSLAPPSMTASAAS